MILSSPAPTWISSSLGFTSSIMVSLMTVVPSSSVVLPVGSVTEPSKSISPSSKSLISTVSPQFPSSSAMTSTLISSSFLSVIMISTVEPGSVVPPSSTFLDSSSFITPSSVTILISSSFALGSSREISISMILVFELELVFPALSVEVAFTSCSPSDKASSRVYVHSAFSFAVVSPTTLPSTEIVIVLPASPSPVIVGLVSFVLSKSLIVGASGACVSIIKSTSCEASLLFPAASVLIAVTVCSPSLKLSGV